MSSPAAGKFQDHYEVLAIDPKSDNEVIQKAYGKLAQRYHPGNAEFGDKEKFEAVNLAYEVLMDPLLRREFDKLKGLGEEKGTPTFTGVPFFSALERDVKLRSVLLCVLYDRRRTKPFTPSLSMRHLENMLEAKTEEINLALWYLKQRNLAANDDKSSLLITVDGMDFLEKSMPTAEMVLPFLKPGIVANAENPRTSAAAAGACSAPAPPPPAPEQRESSISILRRVLVTA